MAGTADIEMAIEAKNPSQGEARARLSCDANGCDRAEIIPCVFKGRAVKGGTRRIDLGATYKTVRALGWSVVGKKQFCSHCAAARKYKNHQQKKVIQMPRKEPNPTRGQQLFDASAELAKIQSAKPPEPTKKERIQIFSMLAEVYDLDAGRYNNGDTDETVAEVLGTMPGFVTQIREAEFGPDGGNEDIEALTSRIDGFQEELLQLHKSAEAVATGAERKLGELRAMKADLQKIKNAVGPRVAKVAGLK